MRDIIVIMGGPKGCRILIPLVHFLNRNKTRVVFCPVGIGTLDRSIKKLSDIETQKFLSGELMIKKDKKMSSYLKKLPLVIVENDILKIRYEEFYGLHNVVVLDNFRDINLQQYKERNCKSDELRIVYLSRITPTKGIFDLLDVVSQINIENKYKILLDIYGDNQLNENEQIAFQSFLDNDLKIKYKGVIDQNKVIDVLSKADIFCLPTRYYGEGTPGSLVEALICGTPVLVSSYSQSKYLVKDGYDGFIYNFNDNSSLKKKIEYIYSIKTNLRSYGLKALESSKKFIYFYNREKFLAYLIETDLR